MKRLVLFVGILIFLMVAPIAKATNNVWDYYYSKGYATVTLEGDAVTGAFAVSTSPTFQNVRITRIVVDCNTATPPTADTTQVIFTSGGVDIAYGKFLALTASEVRESHTYAAYNSVYDAKQVYGTIVATATGSTEASGLITITIYFEPVKV